MSFWPVAVDDLAAPLVARARNSWSAGEPIQFQASLVGQESWSGPGEMVRAGSRLRIPWKGPGADSEEKHEPAGDIDTVVVDSLKALDPERPIREEADICAVHTFQEFCARQVIHSSPMILSLLGLLSRLHRRGRLSEIQFV
jgi:hypothetical protein